MARRPSSTRSGIPGKLTAKLARESGAPPRRSTSRAATRLARDSIELAVAVPQVVAHRLGRMVVAGPRPSSRDQREFTRMVAEKQTAAVEAMGAMAVEGWLVATTLGTSLLQMFLQPASRSAQRAAASRVAHDVHAAALGVLAKGLAPVRRKAVANARRLR